MESTQQQYAPFTMVQKVVHAVTEEGEEEVTVDEAQFHPLLFGCDQLTASLVPRPRPAFRCLQYEKRGEPGILSHVSDVTTNEKLMNVGGLKHNGVIAHAL